MSMKEETTEIDDKADFQAEDAVEISDVAKSLNAAFDAEEGSESVESEPETKATPETTEDKPADAAEGAAEAVADDPELLNPPASWSAASKARFAALEPDVRKELNKEIKKREDDFHKGIDEYRTSAKSYREIMQVMQPYMPMIQAQGGTPITAINGLLNTAYQLQQNPQGTIQRLAQQYGVQISNDEDTERPQTDPLVGQLQNELAQIKGFLTNGQRQQQQATEQKALEHIAKFKADPKHIYFENVRQTMANLIQSGEANDANDAYDKACWLHPEVRAQILEQESKAREQKRIQEAKLKAANAKRAAFDVSGSGTATGGRSNASDDLRGYLESVL